MNTVYIPKVSRRTTLKWLATSMALAAVPEYAMTSMEGATTTQYPNGTVTWQRIFTQSQLQITAALADLILPATTEAPAPSQLGIPEFIDEWVSAPYPSQLRDRQLIVDGLVWVDKESNRRLGKGFTLANESQQLEIVDMITQPSSDEKNSLEQSFFRRLRYLVIGAYYTTPEGFKDIGYIGNVPLSEYPPISSQEKMILDKELAKLGVIAKL